MNSRIFLGLVTVLCIGLTAVPAHADTTFFEGDLGYRDNFIMAEILEEVEALTEPWFPKKEVIPNVTIDNEAICDIAFTSLISHIQAEQTIEYSEEQLQMLADEIEAETGQLLTIEETATYITEFEDKCNFGYPLTVRPAVEFIREIGGFGQNFLQIPMLVLSVLYYIIIQLPLAI